MRGEHERFPDFAFLDFAIAQQGVHVDILSQIFSGVNIFKAEWNIHFVKQRII